jgi:UTP--glucose-1-phosphate uridylyltransferase
MSKIRKAIITTAGYGTRFLPVTKAIQKEMLPILNRPLVDYVVEDCIKAGVEEIIFVVREGDVQIQEYYSESKRLLKYLEKMNKADQYKKVEYIHTQAKFHFVTQDDKELYGTAVPVKLTKEYVKNEEAFFVFMGDDFIYNADGRSNAAEMMQLFEASGAAGVASFIERPSEILHKYGIAEVEEKNQILFLKSLIEKPSPGTAPSNLANISKYILTPMIFDLLNHQEVNPQSGELYITDTVLKLAQQSSVAVHVPRGEYLDGGYPLGWLKANIVIAKNQPEFASELHNFLQNELR